MESNQRHNNFILLSIVSGIITFITGIIGLIWFAANGPTWGGFGGWMGGMMSGYHGFAGGGEYAFFTAISVVGIFSGSAIASEQYFSKPNHKITGYGEPLFSFLLLSA